MTVAAITGSRKSPRSRIPPKKPARRRSRITTCGSEKVRFSQVRIGSIPAEPNPSSPPGTTTLACPGDCGPVPGGDRRGLFERPGAAWEGAHHGEHHHLESLQGLRRQEALRGGQRHLQRRTSLRPHRSQRCRQDHLRPDRLRRSRSGYRPGPDAPAPLGPRAGPLRLRGPARPRRGDDGERSTLAGPTGQGGAPRQGGDHRRGWHASR